MLDPIFKTESFQMIAHGYQADGMPWPQDPLWIYHHQRTLHWLPEFGMGWYPVRSPRYDQEYWDRYQQLAQTEMGRVLTRARVTLVARHWDGPVLDVGIGSGQFVESRPKTYGYDINPVGRSWLQERLLYRSLWLGTEVASFWDSLEHFENAARALNAVSRLAFVSLPIFRDGEHVLRSKHFRTDEHYWYWTHDGFVRWARALGWRVLEWNCIESSLGREDIESFALSRCDP